MLYLALVLRQAERLHQSQANLLIDRAIRSKRRKPIDAMWFVHTLAAHELMCQRNALFNLGLEAWR